MIICEFDFDREDPKARGYSLAEVDVYAHVPHGSVPVRDHRLSLRKNLTTGEFELYAHFFDNAPDEIISNGQLAKVLFESNRRHGMFWFEDGVDFSCDHDVHSSRCSSRCPKAFPARGA